MVEDTTKKRSRILDALANPDLLDGSTPRPAEPSARFAHDMDSKNALDALKRRILQDSPALKPAATPIAGGSRRKKRTLVAGRPSAKQRDDNGSSSPSTPGSSPLPSSSPAFGRRLPSNYDIGADPSPTARHPFDFNLRYDRDVPVHRIDIGGQDQEAKLTEFVSKSFDDMNHGRTIQESLQALGLRDRRDVLPGVEVRLLDHQLIGVSWMLDQELKGPHKGGILADEMGLGKTVQVLAMMAKNMPGEDEENRATLIVVPAALLQQWKEELDTKTNGLFEVHIHHGKDKLKTRAAINAKDVIITTYQTLNLDCITPPDVEPEEQLGWLYQNGGPLIRNKWFRVVLDEAQFVRNRGTRSSKAVAMLRSKYRWAVTGTPVTNTLVDVYGLIRFGRFRPWNDWEDFDRYIGKVMVEDSVLAGMRAQEILKPLLLRRTKATKREDGQTLLRLPEKNVELVKIEFSEEEREIYESVEKRAQININRFIKRGTLMKNNAAVLVMILRLRQLCCHPYLILSLSEDALADPTLVVGSEADKELSRAKRVMGHAWVKEVKSRFLLRAQAQQFDFPDEADMPDETCPMCQDMYMNDSGRVLSCGHEMCFECTLELSNLPLTHTGEIGHGDKEEKEYEVAAAKGYRPCPICKKLVDLASKQVFRAYAFEPSEDELREAKRADKAKRNQKKTKKLEQSLDDEVEVQEDFMSKRTRLLQLDDSDDEMELPDFKSVMSIAKPAPKAPAGKKRAASSDEEEEPRKPGKRARVEDGDDDDALTDVSLEDVAGAAGSTSKRRNATVTPLGQLTEAQLSAWSNGGGNVEASAKMMEMMRLLKEWDASGDKTIVYSQWTSMLDLVETIFLRFGVRNLRYDGQMSREARDRTLSEFRKPGGPKVILISIKCGGIGLNLVSANRVINLDLSWNFATESQAYDRVHRLGQEKEVVVKRLVVKDTIEERMLTLQDVKVGLAEAALGEGNGGKLHKLSVKEIKLLFGFANLDKDKTRD